MRATLVGPVGRVPQPPVPRVVEMLREDRVNHLHCAAAEAMTVHETSFFRDTSVFDALREVILPRLIEAANGRRRLRLWSAACSTGQEAYSLAMLLTEHFPETAGWDVKIVGTDISRQVVEYAARARYRRLEINRGLPARLLIDHFVRDGDEWVVSPQLRAMCEFHCADLLQPPADSAACEAPSFDLVLMRNVLLYLSQADRGRVFSTVRRQLREEGVLLLGNAEQAEDSTDAFQAELANGAYFYRQAR